MCTLPLFLTVVDRSLSISKGEEASGIAHYSPKHMLLHTAKILHPLVSYHHAFSLGQIIFSKPPTVEVLCHSGYFSLFVRNLHVVGDLR